MTPNELVLTFGGLHLCVKFGKSTKKCDRESDDTRTDRQTHRQTDRVNENYIHFLTGRGTAQIRKSVKTVYSLSKTLEEIAFLKVPEKDNQWMKD